MGRKLSFAVRAFTGFSIGLWLWGCHMADIKMADETADHHIQARAYNDSAKILSIQGHLDEAIKNFTKAIELDANYAEALNERGECLIQIGQIAKGCHDIRKACELKFCKGLNLAKERNLCQ